MTSADITTAYGRLRTLWNATVDPQLAMSADEVADVETVLSEHAAMAAELAELRAVVGSVRSTEWGSGANESYVKPCGTPSDAYGYAGAYGGRVFKRKLYAGPWCPDDEESDDDA